MYSNIDIEEVEACLGFDDRARTEGSDMSRDRQFCLS